ncbi:Type 1 glutamine amidotransferase-like domain-containing protein [Cytobacillus firmus]|uniref:Type 1 glutamine amidotransferase-like domain-containing protein n=1 Tax=Cytobacillus firmus TaxID=1399 RepID=UPI0036BDB985
MNSRHLFLMGGSPPFGQRFGRMFTELACGADGKIAILFLEREGWEVYMNKYTSALIPNGARNFCYLPLSPDPAESFLQELMSCSGIIIGGGETENYRRYIVDSETGEWIRRMYMNGIPVAGFSAGALVIPEHCIIPPIDTPKRQHLFLRGLGLIRDCAISVHFTKWNERENLRAAAGKANVATGYGIDDDAGIYFHNEIKADNEGSIHIYKNET